MWYSSSPFGLTGVIGTAMRLDFGADALHGTVERGLQVGLADAEVRARKVGQDQADVVHLGDCDEQVRQRGGGDDAQIGIADRDRDGVFEVRRKFVEEQHQRVAAEQLLPGLGPRRTEQGRNVAGELLGLAELLGDRAPDAAGGIGAASVEADNTAAAELRRRVFVAQYLRRSSGSRASSPSAIMLCVLPPPIA